MNINPDLSDTWLNPTHKEESTDSCGFWENGLKLPFANNGAFPPKTRRPPRRPTDLKITDPNLESMLDEKLTKKPNLPHTVFPQLKKAIDFENTTISKVENLFKKSLTESLLSETYLDLALKLFPYLFSEIESLAGSIKDRETPTFDLLEALLSLAGQNSSRMTKLNISGLVGAKVEMRDKILLEYDLPDKTKNTLRGSGFITNNAFGEIPESLKLCLTSINGKEHMAKAKSSTPASSKYNNRGGYRGGYRGGHYSNPSSNQFHHPGIGARARYLANQTPKNQKNPSQNSNRGAHNSSDKGQGFRGRGRGPRRNTGQK